MQKHYFGVLKPKVGSIQVDQQDIANLDLSFKKFFNKPRLTILQMLFCYLVILFCNFFSDGRFETSIFLNYW